MQVSSAGLWNVSVTGASSRVNASNGAARLQQNKLAPAAKGSVHFGADGDPSQETAQARIQSHLERYRDNHAMRGEIRMQGGDETECNNDMERLALELVVLAEAAKKESGDSAMGGASFK